MAGVTLALLGPPQITRAGGAALVRVRKELALLAYLAVEHRNEHSRDTLLEMFWPESPEEAARNSLRVALSNLRAALGEAATPFLVSTRHSVQFNASSDHTLDVATFERLCAERRGHCHDDGALCAECAARLTQALALYRGDFLAGFTLPDSTSFEEWALVVRERLHQQALEALDSLAAYHDQRGDNAALARAARRQIELEPWREQAHRQLMRALAAMGERAAALAAYERCRQVLEDELGVEPDEETSSLYQRISAGELAPTAPSAQFTPRLPAQLTPFIGRENLLQLASERLLHPQVRLLTLVGPGGIGKTRMSLELGHRLLDAFDQAVCYIDLSSLTAADQVPARLAQGLGLAVAQPAEAEAAVQQFLAQRRMLLILDNFEHLLPAATLLSQLLEAAPGLKLLVASRAVLQLYGESELGIPPMDVPDLTDLPASEEWAALHHIEAVQLFVRRAQAILPTFHLTPANYADIARLCVLLEGVPLSLELAAARIKLMPLPYLYQRLSASKLDTLSKGSRNVPARQQTLRATLDWSYNLLDADARRLFRSLGIFRGSFSLAAVEQVCYGQSAPADVVERVNTLVDQSLLTSLEGSNGEPRCMMLETVREYALQKLREAGEHEQLRSAYVRHYLQLLDQLTQNFQLSPEDPLGLAPVLEEDFDNFQAAQHLAELPDDDAAERAIGRQLPEHPSHPVQVEGSVVIRRPIEEVFAYMTAPENCTQWNFLIKEAHALEPGPTRAGMTWGIRASLLGRRLEQTILISEYRANERFEIQTARGPLKVIFRFTFAEHAGETRVTYTWIAHLSQLFRFTHPLLTRVVAHNAGIMSARVKALLENRPT